MSLSEPAPALPALLRGFEELAGPLAMTLGPAPGLVLNDRGHGAPEILRDAGTFARRVLEVTGHGENAGAMTLRHMVWRMHERYGDGAATAVVLARTLVGHGARAVAAGAGPRAVCRGIDLAAGPAAEALAAAARPAADGRVLARVATGATGDAELGEAVGEVCDVLGRHAALLIEEFSSPRLDREYLDGGRWRARPASRALMPEGRGELALDRPLVLLSDLRLSRVEQVRPALEAALADPDRSPLLVVARDVRDAALQTLTVNHHRGTLTVGAAVLTSPVRSVVDDLLDIAVMTGAELASQERGRPPQRLTPKWLGRARRATLTRGYLTVVGGAGDRELVAGRVRELRAHLDRVEAGSDDAERLRLRLARLSGGVGILKIGAFTRRERDERKALAGRAQRAAQLALDTGVVPGGGVAYLGCVTAAGEARWRSADADEALGAAAVESALQAPLQQIVRNHGTVPPAVALAHVRELGPDFGFDASTGGYARMADVGVLDSLGVTAGALEAATSAAKTLLNTGRVVPARSRAARAVRP